MIDDDKDFPFYEEKPMNNYDKLNTLTDEQLDQAEREWNELTDQVGDFTGVFTTIREERLQKKLNQQFDAFVAQLTGK